MARLLWQLLGIAVVVWELRRTRQRFKRPTIREALRAWLADVRGAWRAPIVGALNVTLEGVKMTGHIGTLLAEAPKTLEQRVAAVEQALDALRNDLAARAGQLTREVERITTAVSQEANERKAGDTSLNALVADVVAGSVHVEGVGLAWLMLGVICTSVPELGSFIASVLR